MSDSTHDHMDLQQPELVPSSIDGSSLLKLGDNDKSMLDEASAATPGHTRHVSSERAPIHTPQLAGLCFDGSVYQEPVFKLVTGRLLLFAGVVSNRSVSGSLWERWTHCQSLGWVLSD